MLNSDSLFLTPLTFFGSYQSDQEETENAEWNFTDNPIILFEANKYSYREQPAGLFLHWYNVNELEQEYSGEEEC